MRQMLLVSQGYRCSDCDHPFTANTPSDCATEVYNAFVNTLTCPRCNSNRLLLGINLKPEENRALKDSGDANKRALNWKTNGETGLSSLTIYNHFMGISGKEAHHPHDVDDLRRCMYLLEHVPEWLPRMPEMKGASPEWDGLATHWAELAELYWQESAGTTGRLPRTYQLLESLISADQDADRSSRHKATTT